MSGIKKPAKIVDSQYRSQLIKNYKNKGQGNTDIAWALYFYLLKKIDTSTQNYSEKTGLITQALFGDESFERVFNWRPQPSRFNDSNEVSTSWNSLLESTGKFTDIEIFVEKVSHQITGFKSDEPIYETKIKLNQGFYFRLSAFSHCLGIGFQSCNNRFYPLRYTKEQYLFHPSDGIAYFPPQENPDKSFYLVEPHDDVLQKYVFIMIDSKYAQTFTRFLPNLKLGSQIHEDLLDQFATQLAKLPGALKIRMVNVEFVRE